MTIQENSDLLYFGAGASLSLICGGNNIAPAQGIFGIVSDTLKQVSPESCAPRDAFLKLIDAASITLSIITGLCAGYGIKQLCRGENGSEIVKVAAGAAFAQIAGTFALRTLAKSIR
jgi:hypothetical protein